MNEKKKKIFDIQLVTTGISTAMVLMLLGLVMFIVMSAGNMSRYVRENISFSVLLSDEMSEPEALSLQKEINKKKYVKATTYISKEQALKEQTEAMGSDPSEFLGENPFTASLEIQLKSDYACRDSVDIVTSEIKKLGKISEISYPEHLLDEINRNIRDISLWMLLFAGLLMLISFSLINNTIRLTIHSERFLIHTMKLVGADAGFIRRPFLLRNMWIGLIAGFAADAAIMAVARALVNFDAGLTEIMPPDMLLRIMAVIPLTGMAITIISAWISTNKYLRMKAAELYRI